MQTGYRSGSRGRVGVEPCPNSARAPPGASVSCFGSIDCGPCLTYRAGMQKNHATAVRDTLQESAEERLSVSIYGDCMAPHLTAGQRVSVQALRRFWPGDILVFYSPRQDRLIAHRLIGAFRRDGRWRLLTQADNAQNPDPALEPHQVIGRVVEPRTSPGKRLAAACRFFAFAWSRLRSDRGGRPAARSV